MSTSVINLFLHININMFITFVKRKSLNVYART